MRTCMCPHTCICAVPSAANLNAQHPLQLTKDEKPLPPPDTNAVLEATAMYMFSQADHRA